MSDVYEPVSPVPAENPPQSQPPQPAAPVEASVPAAARKKTARRHGRLAEYAESLLVTILLALFATTFVVQAFKIPTSSMEPALLVGDHLLVNKFIFGGSGAWYERLLPYRGIRRGDIIVFKFPFDDHSHYVKRVIGLPGERVRVADQQVYINGRPLEEPYKVHNGLYDSYGDNFPPIHSHFPRRNVRDQWARQILSHVEDGELIVPAGRYFVLGDNRDSSLDSRFWGFVDRDSVMGRPLLIYWSVEATAEDYTDRTLAGRLAGLGRAIAGLPSRTRWDRVMDRVE
ncbi:MAG: signal peptidase I [Candidatus Acidiferrales bacterium]